ncbi:hypothetical protein, partial [Klebsiella pneumoniae]|uniref:hypothetical protein n=1 Tax=Klebsiella pneumoniae TaxID=573 RepID=UPI0025A0FB23
SAPRFDEARIRTSWHAFRPDGYKSEWTPNRHEHTDRYHAARATSRGVTIMPVRKISIIVKLLYTAFVAVLVQYY